MMTMGDMIDAQDLPAYMHTASGEPSGPPQVEEGAGSLLSAEHGGTLEEQERILIVRALETAGGNQSQAARILRIGRDALRYKLKKHNLESTH
jgi:DNA-binding NtrC family response regulator